MRTTNRGVRTSERYELVSITGEEPLIHACTPRSRIFTLSLRRCSRSLFCSNRAATRLDESGHQLTRHREKGLTSGSFLT